MGLKLNKKSGLTRQTFHEELLSIGGILISVFRCLHPSAVELLVRQQVGEVREADVAGLASKPGIGMA